jgi:hypothetical protein
MANRMVDTLGLDCQIVQAYYPQIRRIWQSGESIAVPVI